MVEIGSEYELKVLEGRLRFACDLHEVDTDGGLEYGFEYSGDGVSRLGSLH